MRLSHQMEAGNISIKDFLLAAGGTIGENLRHDDENSSSNNEEEEDDLGPPVARNPPVDSKRFEEFVDNELNDEISDLDLSDDDDADPDFQLIEREMGAEEPSSSDDENEDNNSISQNLTESVTSRPSTSDSQSTEPAEPLQTKRASRTRRSFDQATGSRNTRDSIAQDGRRFQRKVPAQYGRRFQRQ
ncbi:nucleolin-like [Nilaparvata lugens]|uniref:nucleolin-like n=1 Tax=Nilaparvata lugens TaxID=108931 RepID=UPI00193C9559|nr:nucleolin-like [Nilaparvata lugens]